MIKKIYILATIFSLMLILSIIEIISTRPEATLAEQLSVQHPVAKSFIISRVVRLEIYPDIASEQKVIMTRNKDNRWQITSHHNAPANDKKTENFLETLKRLKGEERTVDFQTLRSSYLQLEPTASLFTVNDFVEEHFAEWIERLQYRGQFLFSLENDKKKSLSEWQKLFAARGFPLERNARMQPVGHFVQIKSGREIYYIYSDNSRYKIFSADPLSSHIHKQLSADTRRLIEQYGKDYPASFVRFVLLQLDQPQHGISQYLNKRLASFQAGVSIENEILRPYIRSGQSDAKLSSQAKEVCDLLIKGALRDDCNILLQKEPLYKAEWFIGLDDTLQRIALHTKDGKSLITINRLLLEHAYAKNLHKSYRPIHIKVYSEQDGKTPSYHLLVGKKMVRTQEGKTKIGCFVRPAAASNKIHMVDADLPGLMMIYDYRQLLKGMPLAPWLAKVIELKPGQKNEIHRMVLHYPDKKIVFEKNAKYQWQTLGNFSLRPGAVQSLLTQISSFGSIDIAEQKSIHRQNSKQFIIELQWKEKTQKIICYRTKPGQDAFCYKENAPEIIYRINSDKFSTIFLPASRYLILPEYSIREPIAQLELTTPEGKVKLIKKQSWQSPERKTAINQECVERILWALRHITPEDYRENIETSSPSHTLSGITKNGQSFIIQLISPSPIFSGYYIKSSAGKGIIAIGAFQARTIFPAFSTLFADKK